MIGTEKGSILVEAIWIMTLLAMIGSALLYVMLSERQAIGGIGQADAALIEADGLLDRARLMISTPPEHGGWGDAFTTAPSTESLDAAVAREHFVSMDSGKIVVQRTGRPLERRISAVIDVANSQSHGSRIVQAVVRLVGRAESGGGTDIGVSVVSSPEKQGAAPQRELFLVNTEITGSPADASLNSLWLERDIAATLDGVSTGGDAFSHGPVVLSGMPSSITGGSLITFGSISGKESFSGEIIEGYRDGEHDARFVDIKQSGLQRRSYYEQSASATFRSDVTFCSDGAGGLNAALSGECVPSTLNRVRDRWGEPVLDGTVYVEGDAAIAGIYSGSLTVVAAGRDCDLPCGRINIGNGRTDSGAHDPGAGPDDLGVKTGSHGLTLIGGSISTLDIDTPSLIGASLLAESRIKLASVASSAGPRLQITGPIRSSQGIRIGNPIQRTSVNFAGLDAATPLEDFRIGEVVTEVIAWQEVLPSKQRRKLLSK